MIKIQQKGRYATLGSTEGPELGSIGGAGLGAGLGSAGGSIILGSMGGDALGSAAGGPLKLNLGTISGSKSRAGGPLKLGVETALGSAAEGELGTVGLPAARLTLGSVASICDCGGSKNLIKVLWWRETYLSSPRSG